MVHEFMANGMSFPTIQPDPLSAIVPGETWKFNIEEDVIPGRVVDHIAELTSSFTHPIAGDQEANWSIAKARYSDGEENRQRYFQPVTDWLRKRVGEVC